MLPSSTYTGFEAAEFQEEERIFVIGENRVPSSLQKPTESRTSTTTRPSPLRFGAPSEV
jgi:hypothetical protein